MIAYSIIQKSQLEGAHRLDAEYYQPEFLQSVELIKSKKHQKLGDIISVLTDYHANGSYQILRENVRLSEEADYAFMIRAIDLKTNNFDNDVRYVSEHAYNFLKKTKLFGNEIIIDKIGNAGEVYLMPDLNKPVTLGMNLFMLRLKPNYDPVFVYIFLISKYGRNLVNQRITGTVPTSIDKESVRGILIPLASEEIVKQVNSIIRDYFQALKDSVDFYQQAEDLALEELGLRDFQAESNLSFVVNLLDVKSANRVDADYFQPKYQKLVEQIKKHSAKMLTEVVENVSARFNPEPDKTYKYVELANINAGIGIVDGFTKVLGKESPSRAKRILKEGDVVVSSVEGSLEKVALVNEEQDGYLASTGFFQFRSEEILPEVLLVLAKSIVMQWQFKKHCAGTILTAVPSESLTKMFVPTIPKSTQQKIAEMVRKSHDARKRSKELLEQAKRDVEEMIEKKSGFA